MRNKIWFLVFLFFTFSVQLFAKGSKEESEIEVVWNDEWVLCISQFDTAALPENKMDISGVIMKKLVESIGTISYRTRISDEYAYYEETTWARMRAAAAKAISDKQNERSLMVFRGDPKWKYRRNIEKIDADIEKLYIALEEIDENVPSVSSEPVFVLMDDNLELKFPAAPTAGNEYKFCGDQKVDALLTGSIIDFHERFIVSLKLYTVYTQSFIWEDTIIFSHNDMEDAVEEYTRKLIVTLSGGEPAVLAVKTEPEETLVLVNRAFAGREEILNMEYPPGEITITASAPNYESLTFNAELFSGERAEVEINLKPIDYVNVEISGASEGKVYHGALYVGEAPLTLRLPLNQMEYIEFETPDGERASIVFQVFGEPEDIHTLVLPASMPVSKGHVDRARRNYYIAWGGTWVAGIAAWLTYQSYTSSYSAISTSYTQTGSYNTGFFDNTSRMYYISMGAIIAAGAAFAFDVLFMSRYIYTANKGSTTITGGK